MAKREAWKSRVIFIFAAIGSAVGLGNAWRFPGLAAKHGGGTFLLVYFLAMFILGWPLLMMEIGIGRRMQQGAPGAMRGVNRRAEFVGWAATGNAFLISTYYSVVLAWILYMIIRSFSMGGLSSEAAGDLFLNEVLQYHSIKDTPFAQTLGVPWKLIIALLAAWLFIYVCIRKGAHSAGKVVPFTVIIPVVLLLVLAVNGIAKDIPNGSAGIKKFFTPVWSKLWNNPSLWIDAFSQVFYSLSIMMAIMFAYGSFVHKKSNIIADTLIIAVSDMLISILSGVVLFTTMSASGMLDVENIANTGSVSTAFIMYPRALVMLSSNAGLNSFFALVFYLTLLTLAIDSAFSIIEGVSTAISDKFNVRKQRTTLVCCIVAFFISFVYITRGGLDWLDIVDYWCNNFNLITVGIIECVVVGWFFKTSKLRDEINLSAGKIKLLSGYDWLLRIVSPVILTTLFVWQMVILAKNGGYGGYPVWAQIVAGWLPTFIIYAGAIALQIISAKSPKIRALDARYGTWDEMHNIVEIEEEDRLEELAEEQAREQEQAHSDGAQQA